MGNRNYYIDLYRQLCASSKGESIPLFAQDWWLDSACGNKWSVLIYPQYKKDKAISDIADIEAAMPIYTPYRNTVTMPTLTQTTAVWVCNKDTDGHTISYNKIEKRRNRALLFFADKLASFRYVCINMPTDAGNCSPFYWKGFSLNTRYTYRINDLDKLSQNGNLTEELISKMNYDCSYLLRRSIKQNAIVKNCSTEELITVMQYTFKHKNIRKSRSEFCIIDRLVSETIKRKQGLLLGGYDSKGNIMSASFIAWQNGTAFYLAGGSKKDGKDIIRTQNLVLLHSMENISEFCHTFDFEGSMIEGVANYFKSFGAEAHSYIQVQNRRVPLLLRIYRKAKCIKFI